MCEIKEYSIFSKVKERIDEVLAGFSLEDPQARFQMIDENVALGTVKKLLERYEFHRPGYLRGQYNETQLRRDYVDPLFKALGWDVDNSHGRSERYREVVHEDPILILGTTKHLDYSFRIGESRKFVVETKQPSVKIRDDARSAFQLRRYAWNAKLALSILTNFEEFAVYDCTKKPLNDDDAAVARIEYFSYQDLTAKWEWIVSIFSQESILKGSFDRFAASTKGKKGTAEVNDDFLTEIEAWRDALAKNIALRNPPLTVEELNAAVQRTIDRIIFLRICEDRGIERYETLKGLLEVDGVYGGLSELFRRADDRYNSGIFHFQEEKEREPPDSFTLNLTIDDKVLKEIIKRLYYPESPYEFSVIPPVILGQVYEQFLGKVIRLTEGHHAKVEEKPEVKKAGGIYYTPQFVVDYIVKHTVGELVKGKTPNEVAKIKILDPACGSGSFLLGAYQFLLDWHRDWYIEKLVPVFNEKGSVTAPEVQALLPDSLTDGRGKKGTPRDLPIYKVSNGGESRVRSDWKLTTAERKRILINNIYGVDIDTQAVEVTKLSLLLKVLEEESEETVSKQLTLFQERALPSLHRNIRCGNSLIGSDFFEQKQIEPFNFEERKRVNPFNWKTEFSDIMASGGFDTVIGNPPYVRQESLKGVKEYFQTHYATYQGTADLYVYFIEKGISLLRPTGIFSYIVANKWMRANYGTPLRKWLKEKQIEEIVDFGDLPVFQGATTYPCIIRVTNSSASHEFPVSKVDTLEFTSLEAYFAGHHHMVDPSLFDDGGWILTDRRTGDLLRKVKEKGTPLKDYVMGRIYYGIKTGLNKAFVIDGKTKTQLIQEDPNSAEIIKPFLFGRDIERYCPIKSDRYLLYI
ncbi:MAG: Eco57I restriction-modification methylase domain-containing protein, partial [Methanomicrobiales archaeon]|nr:Eco57I restriction-modification methylase domain-containing protein [Methanomicrobiales archaeon]